MLHSNSLRETKEIIKIQNLSYSYSIQDGNAALDGISFYIESGSYTAIVGANGSGKSTLCRLICGLLDIQEGSIEVEPGKRIGLVFQSPKDQIISSKVYRDTAFGPQNLHLKNDEVEMRTIECLSMTELLDKAESLSNLLSLGQTQKLAVAGMLAIQPDILILDEAVAMLDLESRQNIFELLEALNKQGTTIIHITHDIEAVSKAQKVIGLDNGRLFYEGSAADFLERPPFVQRVTGVPLSKRDRSAFEKKLRDGAAAATFAFNDISFCYDSRTEKEVINKVSFSLYEGSLTALTGASGTGKSTLLELGAGLLTPSGGQIYCSEYPALAQQNCAAALFEAFAADDVAFAPKNNGVKGKELVELVKKSMDMAGIPFAQYAERQSAGLSGGEQRRLAIAGILAMKRNVLFFDEPTAGLDGESRNKIMHMLRSLADEGKTVLFTTHHAAEADFADREIKLQDGVVVGDSAAVLLQAQEPHQQSGVPEPVEGLSEGLSPYPSSRMLDSLRNTARSLSGSGWKNKCPLEKLPAGLRILLFLVLFTLSLMFRSVIPCSIMLAVSIVYCMFAKFRLGRLLKTSLHILPFLCFFAVFQIIFGPVHPGEVCYTTWRFFTITPSKLLFCLNSILRTYAALSCISAFFISTTEYDLIDGLKKIIPSKNLILILEVIFRFIPLLVDEAADIIKTQIIRGGLGKVKRKLGRIKAVVPLIVPLVIRTVRRSEKLADAIVMRCFNEK